ncbi:hypothetical protein ADICYQ_4605 [Cyclobacterium qasimii M12-11B]|uniref:Uncharacterized protein n=1 Tax=Cyclobacterium qasimii M12-11B TaxID=641524 RepID=S7V972_9BACT|nr:hypothetical protein ADICYQ_4605 [Cyclobacterium qasimii M12-11B]
MIKNKIKGFGFQIFFRISNQTLNFKISFDTLIEFSNALKDDFATLKIF